MNESILNIRVYYEDTDSGGVVYHANYLKFMERGRTEWLRDRGFDLDVLNHEYSVIFVARTIQLEYLHPGRFNDCLKVYTRLLKYGGASLYFEQKVQRDHDNNLCHATVKVACLNAHTFRPCPMPKKVVSALF
ncbi:tol-pal system-associated acyl-CoA thioesterase [Candidatus Nitrosacidococcus sp. I8]|uniref:tol-pal system-associated acyl-CoA thioesterase n=1 Tax=Candidatus Nitrosacidococcus sp. I8 TaxID=2942908 RepID=UPI0022274AF9|nr:tol-pal system-associated acyl-CoA thioesterase [Candidatus Nitrosacidococcus sp. I8]CAH9019773.1 Acyl-CoA thioesterase YbgC [Candidatus Nitrosacidococcus sp. I8]